MASGSGVSAAPYYVSPPTLIKGSLPEIWYVCKYVNPEGCATFYGCNKDSIKADVLDSTDLFKIHDN